MRFVSLFAGIGGMDLGLERAGWECVAQVENDPWCQEVLAKHWPEVPRYGDVRDVQGSALPACDAIVGGFPCQPVSLAGSRKGQDDPRWLWPQFARLVAEVRPRIAIVENVPGLWTHGGSDIAVDLAAHGYDAEWGRVSAEGVGAPHIRWRVFIVAYRRGTGRREDTGSSHADESQHAGRAETQADEFGGHGPWSGERDLANTEVQPIWPGLREGEQVGIRDRRLGDSSGTRYTWPAEPDVGRVAHGVPRRMDRLRGLGNAVVPQVAEFIAREVVNVPTDP